MATAYISMGQHHGDVKWRGDISCGSSGNSASGNNLIANYFDGIFLWYSNNNIASGNTVRGNGEAGIWLYISSNNIVFHNNFTNNYLEADNSEGSSTNTWDDGYPSEGNCWSDHYGKDIHNGPYQNKSGSDGIGDTPYVGMTPLGGSALTRAHCSRVV